MNFVFIHGWGMDASIWDSMLGHFPKENTYTIDLGFTNRDNVATMPNDGRNIFITHSLGTLWALKNHANNMAGLIAINGFTNFQHFVDRRILLAMQKQLQRSPSLQMGGFWKMINFKNDLDQNLNIDKLHEGLEWLINWDMTEELSALNAPILSLIGDKDPLLPLSKMEQEWQKADNIKIMENGGHLLPLSHPKWCIERIREFTGEFELEK